MSSSPVHDDGELPFDVEVEYEKPKNHPHLWWWRRTLIPIPLLVGACVLLICSSILLLATSASNGSLLCTVTSLCMPPESIPATLSNDPSPPLNESRIYSIYYSFHPDPPVIVYETATPVVYRTPRCNPAADYQNHIMFTMGGGDNAEIFIVDAEGNSQCRVTENLIAEETVAWSPDRQRVLFSSSRADNFGTDIYVMNLDGTNIVNLTKDQAPDYHPVWSPDGTKIAFVSQRTNDSHIYVMNSDGSEVQNLTAFAINAQAPSWSPDGTEIAYMAGSDADPNKFEIFIVNVQSHNNRRITYNTVDNYRPVWSPTESQLVMDMSVTSETGERLGFDIFTLDLNDETLVRRTTTLTAANPIWSPDGDSVAFLSDRVIHILDLDTEEIRPLHTGYEVGDISWR